MGLDEDDNMGILSHKSNITRRTITEKALKKGFNPIHHRIMTDMVHRECREQIGWTEKLCHEMDQLGREDHSYVATRQAREWHDTQLVLTQSCSMPNSTATQLRDDYDQMRAEFRIVKEAVTA